MFDNEEFERWMAQASDTLNSARQDYSNKSYNWCCFKAQQAAEYAVKALLKGVGISAYGPRKRLWIVQRRFVIFALR